MLSDLAGIETISNLFSYDAVLNGHSNPSPTRQRADALRVTQHSLFFLHNKVNILQNICKTRE